ncbi:MAG: biopolymer transporter ExbD [Proteobacteria bacterium]|nr:biopolymer transporter ExbD [Pseudomonadota bacterium]MDA0862350.1 biopolymer transporter ExbD [Pseudomonadota bacterium]MDA1030562.1 biopolymer transporter ExbD [Pseudomonadota bacterium]
MNFRRSSFREEPDINLVPFIDVLIVIVIFLAVTTTYSKYAELKINLPVADANTVDQPIDKLEIAISRNGQYFVNGREVPMESPLLFAETLRQIAGPDSDPVIIISADSNTTHQSVIYTMEAARIAGYGRITFTTQKN